MAPRDILTWRVNLQGVSYPGQSVCLFRPKLRITLQNLNQNQFFNPLVSGSGGFDNEKNVDRKSRWTVPLRWWCIGRGGKGGGVTWL